jgi:hypothetical protein
MKPNPTDILRQIARLKQDAITQDSEDIAAHTLFRVALDAIEALGALWVNPRHKFKVTGVAKFFEKLPATYLNRAYIGGASADANPSDVERMTSALAEPFPFKLTHSAKKRGRPRGNDEINKEINRFAWCAWIGHPPMGIATKVPRNPNSAITDNVDWNFAYFHNLKATLFTPANMASKSKFASVMTNAFLQYCENFRPDFLGSPVMQSRTQKRGTTRKQGRRAKNDYHFDKPESVNETARREEIRKRFLSLILLSNTAN